MLCMYVNLGNSTSIRSLWHDQSIKAKQLLDHRAFLHWYTREGMEEGEIGEALVINTVNYTCIMLLII
jgi:hypothetical protein